jgi:hypothetical protein
MEELKVEKKKDKFNIFIQFGLITFTVLGYILISLKLPAYGLIAALVSEIFWLYSSYKAWKNANQIGMFINTIIITITVAYGIINYWFL